MIIKVPHGKISRIDGADFRNAIMRKVPDKKTKIVFDFRDKAIASQGFLDEAIVKLLKSGYYNIVFKNVISLDKDLIIRTYWEDRKNG